MKVLLLGSGGREHALAWKLAGEGHELVCAPGNPGISEHAETRAIPLNDRKALLDLANEIRPDLIVIGPEDPLIAGLADMLREHGFSVFGPGQDAARLEGSKAFSKDMMKRAGVPTADYQSFSDPVAAKEFIGAKYAVGRQVVVKASGAALGKGAIVCETLAEADEAVEMMLVRMELGEAGRTVVIEDRLIGREFSLLTLVSDEGIFSLPVAQDHKALRDGNEGPNTGGMGTVSPCGISEGLVRETEEMVVKPILASLRELGISYRGVLFSGLLVEAGTPYCLEYNVRFGDPETQSVMLRLGDGLGAALKACADGAPIPAISVLENNVVTVVLASEGYPGDYEKGRRITVGDLPEGVQLFHAGTTLRDGELVTSGGRVLGVSAVGKSLAEARELAYRGAHLVRFEGAQYRRDLGEMVF